MPLYGCILIFREEKIHVAVTIYDSHATHRKTKRAVLAARNSNAGHADKSQEGQMRWESTGMHYTEFEDDDRLGKLRAFLQSNSLGKVITNECLALRELFGIAAGCYSVNINNSNKDNCANGLQELLRICGIFLAASSPKRIKRDNDATEHNAYDSSMLQTIDGSACTRTDSLLYSALAYSKTEHDGAEARRTRKSGASSVGSNGDTIGNEDATDNKNDIEKLIKSTDRMIITQKALLELNILGKEPSLLTKINNTATKMGLRMLQNELSAPPTSTEQIGRRFDFIKRFKTSRLINEIGRELRMLPDMERMLATIKKSVPVRIPSTASYASCSVGCAGSNNTVNNAFEENNDLGGYAALLGAVADMNGATKPLASIGKILEDEARIDGTVFNELRGMLASRPWRSLKKSLGDVLSDGLRCARGLLYDDTAVFIRKGVDEYYDLARDIYEKNVMECQDFLVGITEPGCAVYRDKEHGICIKKRVDRKDLLKKPNKTHENAEAYSTVFTEKVDPHEQPASNDSAKNTVDGFVVLKSNKSYSLVTVPRLQLMNYKINEALEQLLEIGGRICLAMLGQMDDEIAMLEKIADAVAEIDFLISNLVHSRKMDACLPIFSDVIKITGAMHPLVAGSSPSNYYLSPFLNFNVLTGPNMSGKSTYAKGLACMAVLGQVGCPLSAQEAQLTPITAIIYIRDAADIEAIGSAGPGALIIIDELSGSLALQVVLCQRLLKSAALSIFISHRPAILRYIKEHGNLNVLGCSEHRVLSGLNSSRNGLQLCREYLPAEVAESCLRNKALFVEADISFDNSLVQAAVMISHCRDERERSCARKKLRRNEDA